MTYAVDPQRERSSYALELSHHAGGDVPTANSTERLVTAPGVAEASVDAALSDGGRTRHV